jgi:predicted nucleic acid-binding protein
MPTCASHVFLSIGRKHIITRQLLPPEDFAQLRARAAVSSARTQELIEQLRELQTRTTSLHTENARLRDEVGFLEIVLRLFSA